MKKSEHYKNLYPLHDLFELNDLNAQEIVNNCDYTIECDNIVEADGFNETSKVNTADAAYFFMMGYEAAKAEIEKKLIPITI